MKFNLYYAATDVASLLDPRCVGSVRAKTLPRAERKAVTYPRQYPGAAVLVVPAPSLTNLLKRVTA